MRFTFGGMIGTLDKGDLFRTKSFALQEELDQSNGMLRLSSVTVTLLERRDEVFEISGDNTRHSTLCGDLDLS